MPAPPITRIVLYKHGVGYFEREGPVEGDAALTLSFKQAEVSDVLKSLIALDLDGGHIATVSYDSTKPLEQLLAEVALSIPDQDSLVKLLPQLKGTKVAVRPQRSEPVEGLLLGVDRVRWPANEGTIEAVLLSLMTDAGQVRSFVLHELDSVQILDDAVRRDLDYYLRTELSAKKKDTRSFTILARGEGRRTIRLGYTVEAPVWKATYRLILGEEGRPPLIQGWAVVDNTQDEDWEEVGLALVAGLPVSFVHDLYTPRYIRRPTVAVQETTGVLPPVVEEGFDALLMEESAEAPMLSAAASPAYRSKMRSLAAPLAGGRGGYGGGAAAPRSAVSTTPAQVRERKLGDLFAYEIEHPVTIRRNQSALVPIVLREFKGRPVLLYNKATRAENPMRCVEFENTTGLTLEGGPVTVLEGGDYVGEAMLETLKPGETRLVPFAVELGVAVLDNVGSHDDRVAKVVLRKGQLKTSYSQVQQTTYTLRNKSDEGQTVFLDHPRGGKEWTLAEPEEAHEVTENYWRFQFLLPARETTRFVVKQRRKLSQTFALADVNEPQLAFWLDQRYLGPEAEEALRQVIDWKQQAARFEEQLQRLQLERGTIFEDQKRVRENLQSLGDRPAEKGLRDRFVRGLEAQEDRLQQIEREIAEQVAGRDRCRDQINALLAALESEKSL
jgi:hypothetical protein